MNATLANCPPPGDRCGWTPLPLRPEEAALAYPLLMASEGGACEPLDAWRARVRNWLRVKRGRGIVTLRNAGGVIGALFFHAAAAVRGAPPLLNVPFVRLIEPVGGRHGLLTTLSAIDGVAQAQGCTGILLSGQADGHAARELGCGMELVGRRHGYIRRGEDWFRPLGGPDGVVTLPRARPDRP